MAPAEGHSWRVTHWRRSGIPAGGVQQGLLLIADIAGYTRFMKAHRTSLAHAQDIVARLLEALIDAAAELTLVEVEGDAAFLYRPVADGRAEAVADAAVRQALVMHRAFHTRQQAMCALNICPCEGCTQTRNLRVKFVVHLGEVAPQRVKGLTRLAGVDVILIHRMLKNTVPVPEYVLMTETLFTGSGELVRGRARPLEQEIEGLGRTQTWFVDLTELPPELPPAPAATWWAQRRETWGVLMRSLPYMLGIRKPYTLRNLPAA